MSIVKVSTAALIGGLVALGGSAAAFAQGTTSTSAYPGPTTTVAPQPTVVVEDEGTVVVGDRQDYDDCGFLAGATISRSFNGRDAGAQKADKDGCVHTKVQIKKPGGQALSFGFGRAAAVTGLVLPRATSSCAEVQVDGERFAALENDNRLIMQGTGANTAGRTYTHVFDVACPRSGGGAVTTARADGTLTSVLPRTGAELLRWGGAGVLLVGVGGGVVAAERRRLRRRAE